MQPSELISAARNGDRKALSRLLYDNRAYIAALVSRFIDDREKRKDVIQNVCVKVIKSLPEFQNRCRFTTWLYRIVLSEVTDFRRRSFLTGRYELKSEQGQDVFTDLNAPDELDNVSRREFKHQVDSILKEINPDQKAAFSLFYLAGCRGREAARIMNISEANFFMKLKAARDTLRSRLSKKGWGYDQL
ncbi:MAG: RNA polymerase sigma factor [Fibrobacterota bacterium]